MSEKDKPAMDEKAQLKLWAETWRRAGPLLEKIRHEELRKMTEEDSRRAFIDLCKFAAQFPPSPPRTTSGLVEMQRRLAKLRPKPS